MRGDAGEGEGLALCCEIANVSVVSTLVPPIKTDLILSLDMIKKSDHNENHFLIP